MMILQKTKIKTIAESSNSTIGYTFKENEIIIPKILISHIYYNIIHNGQNME